MVDLAYQIDDVVDQKLVEISYPTVNLVVCVLSVAVDRFLEAVTEI